MALRLRRGTNTERQTATFSEGELIYVTDYVSAGVSPLWIGDGSTVGGNEVETGGTPSLELNDLTDVNANAIENNILVYQSGQWTSVSPATLGIGGSGIIDGETYNISIVGSVIGADSSVIIDNVTQVVTANLFVGSGAGLTDINLVDLDDVFAFGAEINDVLTYDGTGWIPAKSQGIELGQTYDIGIKGNVIGIDSSIIVNSSTGMITGDLTGNVLGQDSSIIVDSNSGVITGDLVGNITGSSISYSTAYDIDNITNGVISNLRIGNTGEAQYVKIRRTDSGTATNQNIGLIAFDQIDDTGTTTYASMAFWHSGIYIANSSTGSYAATNYLGLEDGNVCIGDYSPAAGYRLDVRGNGIFSGDVSAAAFKGSLMADDSTTIIDGISGNITAPGYIQFGSFSKIDRDSLAASNGFVIYNTTSNRFQGFQNNAWINLDDGTADP
jgi:hypothetical protein